MAASPIHPATAPQARLDALIALREQAVRLDLAPRGRVLATRSGGHLSRFRGRGMEFDESRVYQPGDDPRHMDWRVTARAGVPHVKLFREARERPVWLLIDQGLAMRFGTRVTFKSVIAAEAAALLGWAAVDRGERLGGLIFDEHAHLQCRPAGRGAGLLPLLNFAAGGAFAQGAPQGGGFDCLAGAGERLARQVGSGSLIAVISDFAGLDAQRLNWLIGLAHGRELLLVLIHDPLESTLPPPGRYPVIAAGRRGMLDLRGAATRAAYARIFTQRVTLLEDIAHRHQAHLLRLATHEPVVAALAAQLGLRPARTAASGVGV